MPFPSSGDPPDSGIEPGSPTLQVDDLSSEPKAGPFQGHLTTYSKLKEPMEALLHLPYTSKQSMMFHPDFSSFLLHLWLDLDDVLTPLGLPRWGQV